MSITFILGAGASCPYGFPTASELMNEIIDGKAGLIPVGNGNFHGVPEPDCHPEGRAAPARALRDSMESSIDAWLAERPSADRTWGRIAIAARLLPREIAFALTRCNDWYPWFFRKFRKLGGLDASAFNVITFNYDRSLEIALTKAFVSNFNLQVGEAAKRVAELPIHHVYGKLGGPSIERVIASTFVPTANEIGEAASEIRVMCDERPNDHPELEKIRAAVWSAKVVCFLGFGYDEANLERIGVDFKRLERWRSGGRLVLGTGYGLSDGAVSRVEQSVWHGMRLGNKDEKVHDFLQRMPL